MLKAWINRQKPMDEESQHGIKLSVVTMVTLAVFLWVVTIPNGAYVLKSDFRQDLVKEIAYIKQIWDVRKHASY